LEARKRLLSRNVPTSDLARTTVLKINQTLTLPEGELSYSTSRSSGPGGQNVNKVESRVTVLFDVTGSETLSEEQKRLILERLATRINQEGILRVISQKHRTQAANREEARLRLVTLLAGALETRRPRKPTRPSAEARRRRLEEKRRRAQLKRLRGGVED
jgi:ribosome-associated protein